MQGAASLSYAILLFIPTMALALLAASAAFAPSTAFTPSPARPAVTSLPRALSPAPQMRLKASLSNLLASAAALAPMAAFAEGDGGINGAFKAAAADALGPAADYAPYIGTAIFVAIYSAQTGALPGGPPKPPDEAPPAPPPAAPEDTAE